MRITSLIAAAAAALLVTAGTAAAETVTSGRLDIHYQDISSDSADATVVGVTGAIAAPITDTVALQLDGTIDNVDTDGSDDINVASGTAHLFRRDENKLYGALAGVIHSDDSTTWGAGVEADFYGENGTVGGRVLYLNNDDADVDFVGVDAHYRHFVNDNLRLELSAGYGQADSNGDDADITGVAAEAEYQFAAAPISLFAGVSWANVDSDFGDEDVTVATVGLRWNFGQGSLKGRDRSGASLKGINDLFGASSIVGAASSYTPPIEEEPIYQYAS